MHAPMQHSPVAFDQTSALNAAVEFISSTIGMPSDAALSSTNAVMEYDEAGNGVKTGYIFTWRHAANNIFGGDAIRVFVDDYQTTTKGPCQDWEWDYPDPPLRPHQYCAAFQWTTVDHPNISYYYRLWRAINLGGSRSVQSAGRSTGQQSIDALTASYSLPPGSKVTGYTSGYWSSGPSGADVSGAQPAWLFSLGDDAVAGIDAFSGMLLGVQSL